MNLLFIGYLRGFGGAQRQIINVANAMSRMGHDVTLISLSDNNRCYEIDSKIKKYYVKDSGIGPFRIIKRYCGLKKLIKRIKPDIVVNFWFQSAYLTTLLKKRVGFKNIYSERTDPNEKQYHGLLGVIRKITLGEIDGFVFQTNAAKKFFSEAVQKRSVVIPNPVFVEPSQHNNFEKAKAIVTVGRLHEQKNLPLLIEAFSEVSKQFPDYQLYIYGDGELKSQLQELINEIGLKSKVHLCGATKDVYSKIARAEVFVLSSNYEGMPNVLLEAMSLGVPCISTNWSPGGVVDIITNRENGIIVERNNKEELAKAILELISDTNLKSKISLNSRKVIEKHNPEIIFNKWEKFLKGMTGDKAHEG